MLEIEQLEAKLREQFPKATFSTDPPERSTGSTWLDVNHGDKAVIIEWKQEQGFGLSDGTQEIGYGEGPHHVAESLEDALEICRGML